jgi:hypothetical protein
MNTLSTDQRWLLAHMGGWEIVDALLSAAGTDRLMQQMWGATNVRPPDGGPQWLRSWETRGGKITAPWREPRVIVTSAQLKRFARDLPSDIRAELAECRRARNSETHRTYQWCHCPWQTHGRRPASTPCLRYHPTDDEDQDHRAIARRIAEWESALLRRALGVETGQLTLFDAL